MRTKQQKKIDKKRGQKAEQRLLGILTGGPKPSWVKGVYLADTYSDHIGIDLIVTDVEDNDYYLQVKSSTKLAQKFRKNYVLDEERCRNRIAVVVVNETKKADTVRQQTFYLVDQMRKDESRVVYTLPCDNSWMNYGI